MRATLAAYCAGVLVGTFSQDLVLVASLGLTAVGLLVVFACRRPSRSSLCAIAFCAGVSYHALWAWLALAGQLSEELAGKDLTVRGVVADIPMVAEPATRLVLRVTGGQADLVGHKLQLSDYGEHEFLAGQRWQMQVRLRRPHGLANPGGRDSEARALQQGIVAVGYVRGEAFVLPDSPGTGLASARAWLYNSLLSMLEPDSVAAAILPALLLGIDSGISRDLGQLFTDTGTSHLFVISGLHVGLIAGCLYLLLNRLLRWVSWLSTRMAVQRLAAAGSLLAALGYALISGFDLPAQRALVMLAVFIAGSLLARSINIWLRYWVSLAVVLTLNPLAAMSAGFWFSFVAVAALLLTQPLGRRHSKWQAYVKPQFSIFIAMLVPMAVWMGQVSLLAPLVNLLAIPFIGMFVVPAAFVSLAIGMFGPGLGACLFRPLSSLLDIFIDGLRWLAYDSPLLSIAAQASLPALSAGEAVLMAIACALLLLPFPIQWRWLALPLLLPVLFVRPESTQFPDRLVVRVFDVGQGLSLLVSFNDSHLLYDTGPSSGDYSVADSAVLPALRTLGVHKLDSLVVSHWDNDHAGGVEAVIKSLNSAQQSLPVLSNSPVPGFEGARIDAKLCAGGQTWKWQEVEFRILHPVADATRSGGNDSSCVLQVRFGEQGVLIPGDISRRVERELALRYGESLASTVLIAPHHGSQTSSSYPLLKTVAPAWVVFSAGFSNSFGHPAPAVVGRYFSSGIRVLSTANSGMITFVLDGGAELPAIGRYRRDSRRYWRRSQNDYWCRYYDQACKTAL